MVVEKLFIKSLLFISFIYLISIFSGIVYIIYVVIKLFEMNVWL